MKIDFLLIVLNGEPFIEAWLKTYEPFANKIIIIEGVDDGQMRRVPPEFREKIHTQDGHSIDNTRQIIKNFNSNKIQLIDESPLGGGLWPSKNAMIRQANDKVESPWLWEADYDEFLNQEHIERTIDILKDHKHIKMWQFKPYAFWKSATHIMQGGWVSPLRRIFRWKPGKTKFTEHRPPNTNYMTDIRPAIKTVPYPLYHYSYLLRKDAQYKPLYHGTVVYPPKWFENKWEPWTPDNKDKIEQGGIGPPRWGKTHTTKKNDLKHPKHVANVIDKLIKTEQIYP